MSDVNAIINVISSQIDELFLKVGTLEKANSNLIEKLNRAEADKAVQKELYEGLKHKYDALKSASTFLGNEQNRKETKLKINALVKEIDYCIAQLSI